MQSETHHKLSRVRKEEQTNWITNDFYFSKDFGYCLKQPSRRNNLEGEKKKVSKYAGEFFDENEQCELVFGPGSSVCSYMPPCKRLWCSTPIGEEHGCKTQHMPWADGTACGDDMWCMRSECVKKSSGGRMDVDGEWGEWQR